MAVAMIHLVLAASFLLKARGATNSTTAAATPSTALTTQNGSETVTINRCHDITAEDVHSTNDVIAKCAKGVLWAKNTGIVTNPEYYSHYAMMNKSADVGDFGDFQCALWHKSTNSLSAGGSEGHECPHPCTAQILLHCDNACFGPSPGEETTACTGEKDHCTFTQWSEWSAEVGCAGDVTRARKVDFVPPNWQKAWCLESVEHKKAFNNTGKTGGCKGEVSRAPDGEDVTAKKESSGMPGYAWVLIILGVCCVLPLLGVCCSAFLCYEAVAFILEPCFGKKEGAQKKKRAVKKPADAPAAAAPATIAPVATTSIQMPAYTYAAPVAATYAAAPAFATYAAPAPAVATYAAPAVATYAQAAPASYAAMPYEAAPVASMSYAAPVASMHYAAPVASMSYAAPVAPMSYTAAPVTYAAAPAAGSVSYPFASAPMAAASYPIAAEPVTYMQ